jgi:hypothetical protein
MIRKTTRKRVSAYPAPLGLFIVWLLLSIPITIYAVQSGQIMPPPAPPLWPAASMAASAAHSADANIYKLVFLTAYSRKSTYKWDKEKDIKAFGQDREAALNSFIAELNKFGSQNYKVELVLDGDVPVAVLKSVNQQYEYNWFETDSYLDKALTGSGHIYPTLTAKGFHLFEHDPFIVPCEIANEVCNTYDNFFLERAKGAEQPVQHRFISKGPVQFWHEGKLTRELLKQINAGLNAGLYPAQLLNPYDLLLESPANDHKPLTDRWDLQLARNTSIWGNGNRDNLPKNVSKLAAQGYRLMMIGDGMALMNRPTGAATPVSYVWMTTYKRDFEQQLAQLQAQGAIFRMVYTRINALGTILPQLIFEIPAGSDGKQREYKVLKFSLYETQTAVNGRIESHIDLAPDSKDIEERLNDLARAGFVVRGLFIAAGYNILLERAK